MTEIDNNVDPELLDDNEEGHGDESAYDVELPDYDHSQFELPEDWVDPGDEE